MAQDPRGPERTVKTVTSTPEAHEVTFEECAHVARQTRHFAAPKQGERVRCFHCGPHGTQRLATLNPGQSFRVPGTINPTHIIQRRCSAAVDELHAIASCELADELDAIGRGHILTPAMQAKLAAYLRDELSDDGMLSRAQLNSGTDARTANMIRRQAQLLLSLVESDES